MKYRFYLQVNEDGGRKTANPVFSDEMSLDYEQEPNQMFFRAKLSGKMAFVRKDYELIMNAPFDATIYLHIERCVDMASRWWVPFYKAQFHRTDCTINVDDQRITVQPNAIDEYNDIVAGLDKEYNLIECAPESDDILIRKRPLIQIYIPGDSIVSCFLGGNAWEENCNVVTDENSIISDYHFALDSKLIEVYLTSSETAANGIYAGTMIKDASGNWEGTLYRHNSDYTIHVSHTRISPTNWTVTWALYQGNQQLANGISANLRDPDITHYTFLSYIGAPRVVTAQGEVSTYRVYARYLCDVAKIGILNTYEIGEDDICGNNRNYHRAIGYSIGVASISMRSSSTPTQYGKNPNGEYYQSPASIYNQKFYPLARSTWKYASLWFAFHLADNILESQARATLRLKDAYSVASVLDSLLRQFAPTIRHEAKPEYSQFLYGGAMGYNLKLYVTPKSNIIVGDYKEPAQKAPTTLGQFLNMLRDTMQLYWHIDNGKLRIEHISWYRNGGSYSQNPIIGHDLTQLRCVRNGKPWAFAQSEYTFDKQNMPERYQFNWMDDSTAAFNGMPIDVISKYVQAGKIEEVSVSNFTSDVDIVLLSPSMMSMDGFALLGAVKANALENDDSGGWSGSTGTDDYTSPTYNIRPELTDRDAVLYFRANAGAQGKVVFYDGETVIYTIGTFSTTGEVQTFNVHIPDGATAMGYYAIGTLSISTLGLIVGDAYELPFVTRSVDNVTYILQNGYLAFVDLQDRYWLHNMPASRVRVNGNEVRPIGIKREKKQNVTFPAMSIDVMKLVKTSLGNGQIEKISVNLQSATAKATLKYDTE